MLLRISSAMPSLSRPCTCSIAFPLNPVGIEHLEAILALEIRGIEEKIQNGLFFAGVLAGHRGEFFDLGSAVNDDAGGNVLEVGQLGPRQQKYRKLRQRLRPVTGGLAKEKKSESKLARNAKIVSLRDCWRADETQIAPWQLLRT